MWDGWEKSEKKPEGGCLGGEGLDLEEPAQLQKKKKSGLKKLNGRPSLQKEGRVKRKVQFFPLCKENMIRGRALNFGKTKTLPGKTI